MQKVVRTPFQINDLFKNSISHIDTASTVPAGQAPRGMYFDIEHYDDNCWYIKNHYADPNLIYGSSTITITDKFGNLLERRLINHLTYRIKQSPKSKRFITMAFNLKLYSYSANTEIIASRDVSKSIPNRYDIQCVDLSENGGFAFYSKSNLVYWLDDKLKLVQTWKIPNKFNRQNKAASPEIQDALSVLELPKKSSIDDVKSAFRKSLIKVHPDVNPGDPFASDKTRRVIEAYEILTRGTSDQPIGDYQNTIGFVQVDFEGDGVSATQAKSGTDSLYVGCYSGKIYLLFPDGKHDLFYDCHAPVRKIRESGKYLYIISDHFWDILLDGISINRISGRFRFDRILFEKTCNAEILNHKIVGLYSLGGIAFSEVEFKDNVADAFLIDKRLRVITGKKSFVFAIQPPSDYKIVAENNLFLP